MDHPNKNTSAQLEEQRLLYRNLLNTVMGDDSYDSRQNDQYLEWTYESFVFALHDAGVEVTEEVLREVIPHEVLRLAIQVNWIPYLDEDGDPKLEKIGDVNVHGYGVKQDFYDAFLRLLLIENYIEYAKQPWAHPTPPEIIAEVRQELGWGDQEFIEKMQDINGTQSTWKYGKQEDVGWRNSKERHGLGKLRQPPPLNARSNKAQIDHRKTALEVIRKHSKKYADLTLERFSWRRPIG